MEPNSNNPITPSKMFNCLKNTVHRQTFEVCFLILLSISYTISPFFISFSSSYTRFAFSLAFALSHRQKFRDRILQEVYLGDVNS